jgi:hypothetical protein
MSMLAKARPPFHLRSHLILPVLTSPPLIVPLLIALEGGGGSKVEATRTRIYFRSAISCEGPFESGETWELHGRNTIGLLPSKGQITSDLELITVILIPESLCRRSICIIDALLPYFSLLQWLHRQER